MMICSPGQTSSAFPPVIAFPTTAISIIAFQIGEFYLATAQSLTFVRQEEDDDLLTRTNLIGVSACDRISNDGYFHNCVSDRRVLPCDRTIVDIRSTGRR